VVEDSPTLNRTLCALLGEQGYAVLSAADGIQALALLRRQPVDLVLADIVMPELDGHGLLQSIRHDPALCRLPVVFITAYATPEDRIRAKENGVEDYLAKPLDPADLLATIRNVLNRRILLESSHQREVEAVRNQILTLVQHEFRTPLAYVMGYAEYLQSVLDEELDQERMQLAVQAILEGSYRLRDLLESFLALAALGNRTLTADDLYPVDPTALWREAANGFRSRLEHARLQLILEEPADPIIAYGLVDLLRDALARLLDNAIRYRRIGSHTIWLSTEARGGYVGWIIRDEGQGIPSDRLAQVIEPFARLPQQAAEAQGIGLGLALVHRIAEHHGGYVSVESREGVGSTFGLWVPDRDPSAHGD
jgi:signal transduction histidine kinase